MKTNKMVFFAILNFLCLSCNIYAKEMAVGVPVLDIRIEPLKDPSFKPTYPMLSAVSGNLDTQLLYGDPVIINDSNDATEWVIIETPQKMCDKTKNNELKNISGYALRKHLVEVPNNYLPDATIIKTWACVYQKPQENSGIINKFSYGTQLQLEHQPNTEWSKVTLLDGVEGYIKDEDVLLHATAQTMSEQKREHFVQETIKQFLGHPYVWGGVSAHDPENKTQTTGNDCAGLTYLIYNRALAIKDFPRNSGDQYLHAPIKIESGKDLQPTDLLFMGKKREDGSTRITHVLIYLGNGLVAESTGLGLDVVPSNKEEAKKVCVRIKTVKELFGINVDELKNATQCVPDNPRIAFFARY